jgi:hypothetical protein
MKFLIMLSTLLFSAPLWALQVEVNCFSKFYQCAAGPGGMNCQWRTNPTPYGGILDMARDPAYPNPSFPYQVWRTQYHASYDGHVLTLDFVYSDHDLLHPLKVYANLNARTVMAETTGSDQIDIALRNQNYGRGFLCSGFRLIQ